MEQVRDVLRGQSVFVTGATGFVGKVLVEKLLRCFGGDVGKVFLLVRTGKGMQAQQRVESEIIASPIFETLQKQLGGGLTGKERVQTLCRDKLVAVSGDVTLKRLGISDEDFAQMEKDQVRIVFHCAASINFDDPLSDAVRLNTVGAMRVMGVSKTLGVRALVHVSTAYVNSNKASGVHVREEVYPLDFDPQEVVDKLRARGGDGIGGDNSAVRLSKLQMGIQGNFPNTYTLTKAMAEVMISRHRGNIPLAIVRPSIVGASWREPCPGWVDVVSAASAVFMGICLGVVTILPGNPRGVADIIPVDTVVNHMLLACADIYDKDELRVSHSCSSTYNPVRWRVVGGTVVASYLKWQPPVKLTPGPSKFRMVSSRQQFSLEWALRYTLPSMAYRSVAQLTGSASARSTAQSLELLVERSDYLVNLFQPFTLNEFFFETKRAKRWEAELDTGQLSVDVTDVAWPRYISNFVYGLNRFVLREDVIPVSESAVSHNDLSLSLGRMLHWDSDHHQISFPGIISDISWAYTSSRKPGYTQSGVLGRLMGLTGWKEGLMHEAKHVPRHTKRTAARMRQLVIQTSAVKAAIVAEASRKGKTRQEIAERAIGLFDEIASTMVDTPPRSFGWGLRKVWRRIYDGIRVHEEGLQKLRDLAAEAKTPIVLVPTHRSYVDFLMLSFVMFALNLPAPYIASTTDFLGMKGVSSLLRASGAFFLRRHGAFQSDPLYEAVFTQYIQQLLVDRQIVEYYIEGTRSRSGKCLEPKDGVTRMCIEPVLDGRVEDVVFVPISIDYEKPIEATVYSHEMLGTSKPPETTENLLKSVMLLGKTFGFVSIQFGEHLSVQGMLRDRAANRALQATPTLAMRARALDLQLVDCMHEASVCMPIHLVATLLLMFRHGVSLEQLAPSVEWLREEVLLRGGHVACAEGEHRVELVKRALRLLGPVVEERQSPRVFEVSVTRSPKDFHNMVILGYYRNKIIHLFDLEALWATVLYAKWANPQPEQGTDQVVGQEDSGLPWQPHGAERRRTLDVKPTASDRSPRDQEVDTAQVSKPRIVAHVAEVAEDVAFLSRMMHREFVRGGRGEPGVLAGSLDSLKARGVVVEAGDTLSVHASIESERVFGLLCSMMWPFIDSYYVAASALIALLPNAQVTWSTLLQRMLMLAENLYHDRIILHYESCSSDTLSNALRTFADWGVLDIQPRMQPKVPGRPSRTEVIVQLKPALAQRSTLQALIDRIDRLRGPVLANARGDVVSTVANFPLLARI
ncbi:Fatty acyl-CoA reductase 2 [Durusdinium trenchii]|uniref:Fatty acyl-CoA reductase 2 n=1 Tax=Durusdinium trenchii TaxID=1381693 RepID=A0ABP0K8M8_9DINO